jgi:hypothetical protein
MTKSHIRKHVICAAAAALLTVVNFSVFVSAEPQNFENRRTATVRVAALDTAPATVVSFPAG